jgi:hypothetical protein
MTTEEAVTHVTNELKTDPSYRISWIANIAMAFYDSTDQYRKKHNKHYLTMVDIHTIANDAAITFLNQLCK